MTAATRQHRDCALRVLLHFAPQATSIPVTVPFGVVADMIRDRLILPAGYDRETRKPAYRLKSEVAALAELVGEPSLFSESLD